MWSLLIPLDLHAAGDPGLVSTEFIFLRVKYWWIAEATLARVLMFVQNISKSWCVLRVPLYQIRGIFFFLEKQVSLFRFPGCDIWSLLLRAAGDHERCGWEQGKESDPALERVPKPRPAPAPASAASQGSDSSSCWCHRRNYHQPVIWWMNVNMS